MGIPIHRLRVVVFDVDDTLYSQKSFTLSGFRAAAGFLGGHCGSSSTADLFYDELVALFEAGQRVHLMNQALERVGLGPSQSLAHALVEAYRAHWPSVALFEDTRGVLESLRSVYRLALVTDGLWAVQQRKVQALGLTPYFDPIIYTGAWGAQFSKPHPRAFQCIQAQLQVRGESCVYVGDNPHKDFVTAKRLGWTTIRVHRPGSEHEHVAKEPHYQEDMRINQLSELVQILS
ncbi:MAG TPA: HAD family hydrolase [Opitutales bacterium]|nr:HAD family hydrolase [Opitutales bacterium]